MAHVYLAYSRQNADFMRRLRGDLRRAGLEVWTDETGLEPGTPAWEIAIQREIEHAGCMVVVLSPDARESLWVTRELNYAEGQGLRIFPVMAEGDQKSSVPIRLVSTQRIDARHNYEQALQQLLTSLGRQLGVEVAAHPVETERGAEMSAAPARPATSRRRSGGSLRTILSMRGTGWLLGAVALTVLGFAAEIVSIHVLGQYDLAGFAVVGVAVVMLVVALLHFRARRWWQAVPFLLAALGLVGQFWLVHVDFDIDPWEDVLWWYMTVGLGMLSLGAFAWSGIHTARHRVD